jgi:acyl-homoserine-lactone acylase
VPARPLRCLWIVAVVTGACGGPRTAPRPDHEAAAGYQATVRWTSFGVPHVIADGLGDLGFGQGWAAARQHLCRLADQFVRVRSERARWFGAGDDGAHLDSDFFHLHVGLEQRARALLARQSDDADAIARGWVAGYNHYLASGRRPEWPPECRGADWVRPIDELDLARLMLAVATIASSRRFTDAIATAAPDQPGAAVTGLPDLGLASNAWAIGGDRTRSGGGLVVANPHFPWEGELVFSEIHLTVPGELDVYGAGIPGLPLVNFGFTRHHAWTHTFSASTRFVVYRLTLADGDPYRYVRDGAVARMSRHGYEIDVRQPDGSLARQRRTLYRAAQGPVIATAELPWSGADGVAHAFHDAALDSAGSAIDLYLGFARAGSLDQFRAALDHRATPFVNTLYADVDGTAWYVDGSAVANLTDEALATWELGRKAAPAVAQAWRMGVPIVDGSTSRNDPVTDDPSAPGIVPLRDAPEMLRRDFVFNANDSYGYTNPATPLVDYSPLFGAADAPPSPRSLINLRMLRERGVSAAVGADGVWTRQEAAAALLSNRSFTGEQLRDDVVARCLAEVARRAPRPPPPRKPRRKAARAAPPDPALARLSASCVALQQWDLRFGTDSRGAPLWRELMVQLAAGGRLPWQLEFDPAAPSTPAGLPPAPADQPDPVIAALERAADLLGVDPAAPAATLGELQRAAIGSRIPVPGGGPFDGVANVATWLDWNGTLLPRATRASPVSPSGLGADGYPINFGTSWIMVVDLDRAAPAADVLMTYGPPRSPDATGPDDDQLALFAAGRLRPALFDSEAIAADPNLVVEHVATTEAR